MNTDLLAQLRDIHNPKAISIWPLAMGWYVLIAFAGIVLLILGYFWLKYIRKHRLKHIVLLRIEQLQQHQSSQHHVAEELSILLKRAALATFPRHEVAGMYGEQWLQFLDKTSATEQFSQGLGRLLLSTPYQGDEQPLLPEQFFELIKYWVQKNL